MKTDEMLALIGTVRYWVHSGVWFPVTIRDVRNAFGRTDVQVEPVGGRRRMWVNITSTTEEGDQPCSAQRS